jgi:hypothetical protein
LLLENLPVSTYSGIVFTEAAIDTVFAGKPAFDAAFAGKPAVYPPSIQSLRTMDHQSVRTAVSSIYPYWEAAIDNVFAGKPAIDYATLPYPLQLLRKCGRERSMCLFVFFFLL